MDEIRIKLEPTQQAFVTSHAEADLMSCRMGEGKSTALCWAIFHHTRLNPGAHWAMIRDTWVNLERTTLQEFFKWFPIDVIVDYRKSEKRLVWRPESRVRGDIVLMGMDDAKDAKSLQSLELAGFVMDEPAPAADSGGIDSMIFTTAMTRLRQPGMKWHSAKLAQNSSDESHWTYKMFFDPGTPANPDIELLPDQKSGYRVFETAEPENTHLKPGYYEGMRAMYEADGRPDLADRFADGKIGFQQLGKAVTPEFSKPNHVAKGLLAISNAPLQLMWDFGVRGTCCVMAQNTPMGHWNILESHLSDGSMGIFELIEEVVGPRIADRFHGAQIRHYGDPAGESREASSSKMTAVRMLKDQLGGKWNPGPVQYDERVNPLRRVLGVMRNAKGLIQIDEDLAKEVWHALRGGWHYKIGPNGVPSDRPPKNESSHPGDCMGYGAAVIYPGGVLKKKKNRGNFEQLQRPRYGPPPPLFAGSPPATQNAQQQKGYGRPNWGANR